MLLPVMAAGATLEASADAGVATSDNITRVHDGTQSDTILSAGVQFAVLQETRRTSADITGNLAYLDYVNNTYEGELVGTVRGFANLRLVEDVFSWAIEDNFTQTRVDLQQVLTPDNRELVNYLSTGPDLRLRMGSVTSLLLNARYGRLDYEVSPYDSNRYGGGIALERVLSSEARLSLDMRAEEVEPSGANVSSNYRRWETYLGYRLDGASTSADLQAGYASTEIAGQSDGGPLLRADLRRAVGKFSTVTLSVGRESTDAGSSLAVGGGFGTLPPATLETQYISLSASPYVRRYAEAGWQITGRVTSLGFTASASDEDHGEDNLDNRDLYEFSMQLGRSIGTRSNAWANANYTRSNFQALLGHSHEWFATIGLGYRLARQLGVDVAADYYDYSTGEAGSSVSEVRYWLKLRYGMDMTRGLHSSAP